jgi:hypothetical protein
VSQFDTIALRTQVHDPWTNKGTGFELPERDRLRIRGLVPPRTLSLDVQAEKIVHAFQEQKDPLDKSMYLNALQDRNETLFFRVLIDNLSSMAPYVYTPTVGLVCQRFGSFFRRARGTCIPNLLCGRRRAHPDAKHTTLTFRSQNEYWRILCTLVVANASIKTLLPMPDASPELVAAVTANPG